MFEALKSAWYYKYLYNRPAPATADTSIQALLPVSLPGYPSEDAVESGVAVVMMKLLFPTGGALIDQKVAEQQQVALLSGRATATDIAAGYALGQAVAAVFQARAGTDGMKAAAGTTAQWQAIADAVTAKGEIAWKSQEVPPRPPMLPFFGAVKGWNMTPADIVNERPGPPPSTSSAQMKAEIAEVIQVQKNLTRAQLAIATKWADGVSSPTPPGHWNFIAESYIGSAGFSEVRAARAFALLNMALMDAAIALLGHEVLLLQSAAGANGQGDQDGYRSTKFPRLYFWTLRLLGRRRIGSYLPVSQWPAILRRADGRSSDLPSLWGDPFPLRHRSGQNSGSQGWHLHR